MKKVDKIAILFTLTAAVFSWLVSWRVYENIPHIEDEITYIWQARLLTKGQITIESPVCPECFLEPFVIDSNGIRFGKYPIVWPMILSLGELTGLRSFVNPFFAGFSVWLIYLLGKKVFNEKIALLSAFLTMTSPFFLINTGSLLSHTWSLFLCLVFINSWLDLFFYKKEIPQWIIIAVCSLSLGLLILSRPFTALGISIPFFIHGIFLIFGKNSNYRWIVLFIGAGALLLSGLHFLWQYSLTGDFLTNPYTLYWPYDKIGFGPDVGINSGGHNLHYAWVNTKFSLRAGSRDLFGWLNFSWLFLIPGLVYSIRSKSARLVIFSGFSLIIFYGLYWIGSWLLGPRYYFESLPGFILPSSAGIYWFINKLPKSINLIPKLKFLVKFSGILLISLLIVGNLVFYLPQRFTSLHGLYNVSANQLEPLKIFNDQNLEDPVLIIVNPDKHWLEYGGLLELSSPFLDTPLIFTYDRGEEKNQLVINAFPDREVFYYYPENPELFYSSPKISK